MYSFTRGYSHLCSKALGYSDVSCDLIASNFVMTFQVVVFLEKISSYLFCQAMFLSIVLGSSATLASTYILFGLAILQFFVDTVKIILYKKRGEVEKLTESVQVADRA